MMSSDAAELSIHDTHPPGSERRLRPRAWIGLSLAGLVILLGTGVTFAFWPMLETPGPEIVRLMAATPAAADGGPFSIRLRLQRTDGTRLGTGLSTNADLIDIKSGKRFMGRQCKYSIVQGADPNWMEVIFKDSHPRHITEPRRLRAKINIRIMPQDEMLQYLFWELSGRHLPQPAERTTGWRRFAHDLVLMPPAASTSPTDQE